MHRSAKIIASCLFSQFSSVPTPVVLISPSDSVVISGSPLSLSCSIEPASVDTPIAVTPNWTFPNSGSERQVEVYSDTRLELKVASVETADTGDYTCSVRVTDSSESEYVIASDLGTHTIRIIVSKF